MTTKISITFATTTTLLEVVIKAFIGREISQSDHNKNRILISNHRKLNVHIVKKVLLLVV